MLTNMNKVTKTIYFLSFLVAILIFARIIVSNAFAVDGIVLSHVQNEIATLDRTNMILKEQVYTASSYTTLASDAASLGFVEEKSELTISNTSSLAIRQ